jgi:hypothetical protein
LDVAVKGNRFILSEDIDTPNVRIDAIGESEVNNAINPAKGDCRFGTISGKGIEPLPSTAC